MTHNCTHLLEDQPRPTGRRSRPLVVAIGLVAGLLPGVADAQSLGMAPAEIRASVKPGEAVRFEVAVSNDSATPVSMNAMVLDLWYNERNEKIFDNPGTLPRSAANWIEFVPRDFVVPAHGTGTVSLLVTPPADAVGGHYAVLFAESKPELAQAATPGSGAIYANIRLGAIVLLSAAGTEMFDLDVTNVRVSPPTPTAPLEAVLDLFNRSNTHVFPEVRLTVLDANRQLVVRASGGSKRLFPDQRAEMRLNWSGTLQPGNYTAIVTLVYGDDQVITSEVPLVVPSPAALARHAED